MELLRLPSPDGRGSAWRKDSRRPEPVPLWPSWRALMPARRCRAIRRRGKPLGAPLTRRPSSATRSRLGLGQQEHPTLAKIPFSGTQQQLEQIVSNFQIPGAWMDCGVNRHYTSHTGGVLCYSPGTSNIWFQGKATGRIALEQAMATALGSALPTVGPGSSLPGPIPTPPAAPVNTRIFVVHGHDEHAREQLELILFKLGLQPFVLQNSGGGGLTIIEALEKEIATPDRTHFGIVLMTPDDMGYSAKDGATSAAARARQNVVLEMGMLIAALRRPKVAILRKGFIESPSDASGILYKPFNTHVKEVVPWLVERLRDAGILVSADNVTNASS